MLVTVSRVVVISLRRRSDRLKRMLARMSEIGWALPKPEVFDAIDGGSGLIPCPHKWRSGGGAYGCQQSHLQVLQRALMDGVENLLVLEDDAEFREDFTACSAAFFENVPDDWECLMVGGQHMHEPQKVSDGVVRCINAQRTHAYIVNKSGMEALARLWSDSVNHIDWDMGPFLGSRKKTYAPESFLIGQSAARSDISGRRNPAKFWAAPSEDAPVVWLMAPRAVAEGRRDYGCHCGFDLDQEGVDNGLNECFPSPGKYVGGIGRFIETVKWECASLPQAPGICTIWHPNATAACEEALQREAKATVIQAETLEEAKEKAAAAFPSLFVYRKQPLLPPVALLKLDKQTVEALIAEGSVHIGNWRNEQTGVDNGLDDFFAVGGTSLRRWHSVLEPEAEWKNTIVGIWHPKATEEIAATTGRRVVVIDATTAQDAKCQLEAGQGIGGDIDTHRLRS